MTDHSADVHIVSLLSTFDLYEMQRFLSLNQIKMTCCENGVKRLRKGEEEEEHVVWWYYASGWVQGALGVRNTRGSGVCLPPHHNTVLSVVCMCVCVHLPCTLTS